MAVTALQQRNHMERSGNQPDNARMTINPLSDLDDFDFEFGIHPKSDGWVKDRFNKTPPDTPIPEKQHGEPKPGSPSPP